MEEERKEVAEQNVVETSAREENQTGEFQKEGALTEGMPSSLDRLAAVLCQGAMYLGLVFILPLIVLVAIDKNKKPFLWNHAKQALVFQGVLLIGSIALVVLTLGIGGIFLIFAIPLALLFNLKAMYKAAIGEPYEYPMLENI